MEVDSITQLIPETSGQSEGADLVIGILAELDQDGVASVCQALRTIPGRLRVALISKGKIAIAPQADSVTPENGMSLTVVPWPVTQLEDTGQNISTAYQSIFLAAEKLEARACCIMASKLETGQPQWICNLAQPLLDAGFDLVLPRYARHTLQGMLNNSIIYPLIRSLYGKQIQNPMGPDLGVSRRLFNTILGQDRNANASGRRIHPLASLSPIALCNNLQVCQVQIGARVYPPTDWTNISSLLVAALGPIFLDMEKNAPCWQRIRGSMVVSTFGEPQPPSPETGMVDVGRLVNSFQLGSRELQEIWGLVLPPATLFELMKLSRLAPEKFQLPDELWARIVYDFALAHRLRTINRDHLLRSMTPLYLGWIASHAREVETTEAAVEDRLERLSIAYEVGKPYLVSRWRWPDRFNP